MHPPKHQYHCQDAVQMNKTVMIAWVGGLLKKYTKQALDHIIPLFLIDS